MVKMQSTNSKLQETNTCVQPANPDGSPDFSFTSNLAQDTQYDVERRFTQSTRRGEDCDMIDEIMPIDDSNNMKEIPLTYCRMHSPSKLLR